MKKINPLINLSLVFLFTFTMLLFLYEIVNLNEIKNDDYNELNKSGKILLSSFFFGLFFSITLILINIYYFWVKTVKAYFDALELEENKKTEELEENKKTEELE